MRIFGISIVTIIVVAGAYWLGTRNALGAVLGKVAGVAG